FPFYHDLARSVIKTIMGQSIDLIVWTPPGLHVEKDYNIEFPLATYGIPFLADVSAEGFIEGGFGLDANISLGLSTRGLVAHKDGNSNNLVQKLTDGIFLGDNKPDFPNGDDGFEVSFFSQVTVGVAGTVHVLGFDAAQIYGGGRIKGTIGLDVAD